MTRETAKEIEHDAALWAQRLDAHPDAETLAAVEAWLDGDRRRRGALLQMESVSALAGIVLSGNPLCLEPSTLSPAKRWTGPPIARRRLIGMAAAGLGLTVAGAIGLALRGTSYRTALGEVRSIPLADGSLAVMNTQSQLDVAITSHSRTMRLDTGEVWFQVAHDRAKPFVVEAGPVRVRAVGTAFSVRRFDNGSRIDVSEGRVEIWSEYFPSRRIALSAGETAFLTDTGKPIGAAKADVERRLAWRDRQVDLAGETLAQAVEEFNRYNKRQLVIADQALGRERLYGLFRAEDPESFAIAVHDSLKVPVSLSDPAEIRIGAAPQ